MSKTAISVIIPARNEAGALPETLRAVNRQRREAERRCGGALRLIVVDDGSRDDTAAVACEEADLVVRLDGHLGKGAAMRAGWKAADSELIVFLDADLRQSADNFIMLLHPLLDGEADLTVAELPAATRKGGFGLVRRLAAGGVARLGGYEAHAPLSGQRAMRKAVLERTRRLHDGFGVEVGLLIDALRAGFRVQEVAVPFRHRETGRDLSGWLHRGRQLLAVGRALWLCWRKPVC